MQVCLQYLYFLQTLDSHRLRLFLLLVTYIFSRNLQQALRNGLIVLVSILSVVRISASQRRLYLEAPELHTSYRADQRTPDFSPKTTAGYSFAYQTSHRGIFTLLPSLTSPKPAEKQKGGLTKSHTHIASPTMSGPVPTATSLADIYPPSALAAEAPRWNALLAKFQSDFGRPARFVSRSPGRVNIIGEHIDYSLYSVLPMAITADAIIAVATKPAAPDAASFTIRVRNVQGAKFAPADFEVPFGADVDIDSSKFEWTNYFKSGLRGALGLLYQKKGAGFRPCDMEVLMDGNVPVGGGLSSSAAFVTASALAVMVANGETAVDKKELTELAIVSERAVGVNSGGYVFLLPRFSALPPVKSHPV